jgi:inorganic pyrophosphatase
MNHKKNDIQWLGDKNMIVNVMIEIPKGSRNKYEYDTGKKRLKC